MGVIKQMRAATAIWIVACVAVVGCSVIVDLPPTVSSPLTGTWTFVVSADGFEDSLYAARFDAGGTLVTITQTALAGGRTTLAVSGASTVLVGSAVSLIIPTDTGTATFNGVLSDDRSTISGTLQGEVRLGGGAIVIPAGAIEMNRVADADNANDNANGDGNDDNANAASNDNTDDANDNDGDTNENISANDNAGDDNGNENDNGSADIVIMLAPISFVDDVPLGEDPAIVSIGGGTVTLAGGTAGSTGVPSLSFDDSFAWNLPAGGTTTITFNDLDVAAISFYLAHLGVLDATLTVVDSGGAALGMATSYPALTRGDAHASFTIDGGGELIDRVVIDVSPAALAALDQLTLFVVE